MTRGGPFPFASTAQRREAERLAGELERPSLMASTPGPSSVVVAGLERGRPASFIVYAGGRSARRHHPRTPQQTGPR